MTPFKPVPFEAEAIEAAVGAYRELHLDRVQWTDEQIVETVGRHLLDAMGMRVEEGKYLASHPTDKGRWWAPNGQYRFVSDWFPIKGSVDE